MKIFLAIMVILSFASTSLIYLFFTFCNSSKLKSILKNINYEGFSEGPMGTLLQKIRELTIIDVLFFNTTELANYSDRDERIAPLIAKIKMTRRILKIFLGISILGFVLLWL